MAPIYDSEYIIAIIAYLSPYIKLVYSVSAANYKMWQLRRINVWIFSQCVTFLYDGCDCCLFSFLYIEISGAHGHVP